MSQLTKFYEHGTEVAMTKIASYNSYKKNVRGLEHADSVAKRTVKRAFAGAGTGAILGTSLLYGTPYVKAPLVPATTIAGAAIGGTSGLISGVRDVVDLRTARKYVNEYPKEIEKHREAFTAAVEDLKAYKPDAIASKYTNPKQAMSMVKRYHEHRIDELSRDHKAAKKILQKNIGSKKGFSSSLFKKLIKAVH